MAPKFVATTLDWHSNIAHSENSALQAQRTRAYSAFGDIIEALVTSAVLILIDVSSYRRLSFDFIVAIFLFLISLSSSLFAPARRRYVCVGRFFLFILSPFVPVRSLAMENWSWKIHRVNNETWSVRKFQLRRWEREKKNDCKCTSTSARIDMRRLTSIMRSNSFPLRRDSCGSLAEGNFRRQWMGQTKRWKIAPKMKLSPFLCTFVITTK